MGRTHMRPARAAIIVALAALTITGCAQNRNNLPNNAADLGLSGAAPGSTQDFTVNVGDRIFFDTDSSVIRADAQATLARQAQWLGQYPNYQITIEGHADERGTREYNLALGARRAESVRTYLINRGIPAGRIETSSTTASSGVSTARRTPAAIDVGAMWSSAR